MYFLVTYFFFFSSNAHFFLSFKTKCQNDNIQNLTYRFKYHCLIVNLLFLTETTEANRSWTNLIHYCNIFIEHYFVSLKV